MNTVKKEYLMTEVKMQTAALKKINVWKKLAILVSTIGAALAYGGLAGTPSHLFYSISGILLTIAGFAAAVVLNLGIKNGRRNVEKMIQAIDEGRKV